MMRGKPKPIYLKLRLPVFQKLQFDVEAPSGKPSKKVQIQIDDGTTLLIQNIEVADIEQIRYSTKRCRGCKLPLPVEYIRKLKEAKKENARRSREKAKRQGKKLGAKPKIGDHLKPYVAEGRRMGASLRKIAQDLGVSPSSVQRFIERHEI